VAGAPIIFDRRLISRRRARAAALGQSDFLLAHAADDLADRLSLMRRRFAECVVLGAYHGLLARRLRDSVDRVLEVELSPPLAAVGPDRSVVVADEEAMPLAPASVDLIASALSLHLVNDLPGTLLHVREALRPDGLFLASLLGGRTLHELRSAFLEAESAVRGGASPRVAPFADVRDLGALLQRAGFALPVADSDTVTVAYETPLHLMRDLKAMGAANPLADRSRTPLTRSILLNAADIYRQRFARADGRVLATFEIVTLSGWAPHESQQRPLRPGSAEARLADALGAPETPAGESTQVAGRRSDPGRS
jgi:SAM-dependent methyltransferase